MALIRKLVPVVLVLMAFVLAAMYGALEFTMRRSARVVGPRLGSRTAIAFRVDNSFTATERVLILGALREIKRVSGCVDLGASFEDITLRELLSWRRDGRATIHRASHPATWMYHMARYLAGPGWYMGIALIRTGDVFIMSSQDDDGDVEFRNTVIHEVLHVVFNSGWHSSDPNSLMYHSIGGSKQKLLATEIAALRAMCSGGGPDLRKVSLHGDWVQNRHFDAYPAAVPGAAWRVVQQAAEIRP